MRNSTNTRRQSWLTAYRVVTTVLIVALVVMVGALLARPTATPALSAAEIAHAVNGPSEFQRPSSMEYVAKTDTCIVGGTVVSTQWNVGGERHQVAEVDWKTVDYTSITFLSDQGREFNVSARGALWSAAGANLGLQLHCDPATMDTAPSFGMISIIWGGA